MTQFLTLPAVRVTCLGVSFPEENLQRRCGNLVPQGVSPVEPARWGCVHGEDIHRQSKKVNIGGGWWWHVQHVDFFCYADSIHIVIIMDYFIVCPPFLKEPLVGIFYCPSQTLTSLTRKPSIITSPRVSYKVMSRS